MPVLNPILRRYVPMEIVRQGHPVWTSQSLASELARDSSEHGAPWISFGDVHVDSGGNAFTINRATTCYVSTSAPMPRTLWVDRRADAVIYQPANRCGPDSIDACYGVTIPAYNAFYRCLSSGLARADYGRTWHVYDSRADYIESLD